VRFRLACFLLVASAVACGAADRFPEPVKTDFASVPADTEVSALPEGLRKRLAGDADRLFIGEDGKLATMLEVLACDLNGDGEKEYFVGDPASYTGGRMFHIFGSAKTDFAPIGAVQNEFYFAKPVDNYYQIVTTARAGGDSYERRLETFGKGAYRTTRAAEYRSMEGGELEFVKELAVGP
jgi:hypothetical protein